MTDPDKTDPQAAEEFTSIPGMLGDGTMEQNLNQPGDSQARISQDDLEQAFGADAEEQQEDNMDGASFQPTEEFTSIPGMLGDGTMEQNLNQPGDPQARISQDDVEQAFGAKNQNAAS